MNLVRRSLRCDDDDAEEEAEEDEGMEDPADGEDADECAASWDGIEAGEADGCCWWLSRCGSAAGLAWLRGPLELKARRATAGDRLRADEEDHVAVVVG